MKLRDIAVFGLLCALLVPVSAQAQSPDCPATSHNLSPPLQDALGEDELCVSRSGAINQLEAAIAEWYAGYEAALWKLGGSDSSPGANPGQAPVGNASSANATDEPSQCDDSAEPLPCLDATWTEYVEESRDGDLARAFRQVESMQMDSDAFPTWRELAIIQDFLTDLDRNIDQAYRKAAATEFSQNEQALRSDRVELAGSMFVPAVATGVGSAIVVLVWGLAWKKKMAMWVGYNAKFKSLDPLRLGVSLAGGALVLGLAACMFLGLGSFLQVIFR